MMLITEAIADAAIEFTRARFLYRSHGGAEKRRDLQLADEKLFWMVDAKEHGWSPDDFESEL